MIAAMAKNRIIGNKNQIPWKLKEDFQYFKQNTSGHPIIMGRNTFNSLKNPLPNREHIILTRYPIDGFTCFESMKEALDYCKIKDYPKAFLIGGSKVYEEGLNYADTILLTQIEKDFDGDTKFPLFDRSNWKLTEMEKSYSEENEFYYTFNTFEKNTDSIQ